MTGPLWVAQVLQEEAERQLYDEDVIRGQIAELQQQHQAGEIDKETLERQEEALFERLLDARDYHRRKRLEQQES